MTDTPYKRGRRDCGWDANENAPFASVGGLARRKDMICPEYIKETHHKDAYLRGYRDEALAIYGPQWETCQFSWQPAIVINPKE